MAYSVTLKKNEDHRLLRGHLWAFSNEIQSVEGDPQAGDIVELKNSAGKFLGLGFYNPHSLIAVRLLTREQEEISFDFFKKRIESALALRKQVYPEADAFRLVHGESDFLPGLIIDKYNQYLSVQAFSGGMDKRMTLICDVLESLLHPEGIIERNDIALRELEQLSQQKGIVRGTLGPVTIHENGIAYNVDLLEGQKTGFFFDQRENRKAFRRYTAGGSVLDVCCNSGGFALNAADAGARHVTAIDAAESAVDGAKKNAALNKLDGKINFQTADMFEFLKKSLEHKEQFDTINLDPPSFAKNKKAVQQAKRGYKDLHCSAISLLSSGGILATASCSHHINEETFLEIIADAARSLGRNISLLEWHGAAPDHPALPGMPETSYLKFGIFRVL